MSEPETPKVNGVRCCDCARWQQQLDDVMRRMGDDLAAEGWRAKTAEDALAEAQVTVRQRDLLLAAMEQSRDSWHDQSGRLAVERDEVRAAYTREVVTRKQAERERDQARADAERIKATCIELTMKCNEVSRVHLLHLKAVRVAVQTLLDGGWLVRPRCEHDILDGPCKCDTKQRAFDAAFKALTAQAGQERNDGT